MLVQWFELSSLLVRLSLTWLLNIVCNPYFPIRELSHLLKNLAIMHSSTSVALFTCVCLVGADWWTFDQSQAVLAQVR